MDSLSSLLMKKALLEQELKTINMRIEYVRLIESEQKNSSSTVDSQSKTEQVDDLPKIMIESSTTPQKEILAPSSSDKKPKTSPVQTVAGKDLSKPLMAVHLPKMQQDQSSKLITESVNLRPNQGIKINKVEEDLVPLKDSRAYYVVFNGLNAGIYQTWETTKKATEGVPNVKFKKYKSLLEATTAARVFAQENFLPEAKLISTADCLKPNTFSIALRQPKKTKISLGKPISPPKEAKEEENDKLSLAGFEYWYTTARNASEKQLIEEHYFTTDNVNLSYYNFLKNSNPEQVFEAFQYGLVKMIYPSYNLQELKAFPKAFVSAIKKFRQNCLKTEKDIYIKVLSSIPVFNGEFVYVPQHIVQIGISNGEKYVPSKVMECTIDKEDLHLLAKNKLGVLLDRAFSFSEEEKIFINYNDDKILLFSKNIKPMGKDDVKRIFSFQNTFITSKIFGDHFEDICSMIKAKADSTFTCALCKATAEIKSSLKVDPTTKQEDNFCFDTDDFIFGPANIAGPST